MSHDVLDYAPAKEVDTGLFVARYFQTIAILSVGWMIAQPIFFDRFTLDLSSLALFYLAYTMKQHNAAMRKFVLLCGGFGFLLCAGLIVYALLFGTNGLTIHVGRKIRNPSLWQVFAACGAVVTITAVPFFVLLSASARRQFGGASDQAQRTSAVAPPPRPR